MESVSTPPPKVAKAAAKPPRAPKKAAAPPKVTPAPKAAAPTGDQPKEKTVIASYKRLIKYICSEYTEVGINNRDSIGRLNDADKLLELAKFIALGDLKGAKRVGNRLGTANRKRAIELLGEPVWAYYTQ